MDWRQTVTFLYTPSITPGIRKSRRTGAASCNTINNISHGKACFLHVFYFQAQDACQMWKLAIDLRVRWELFGRHPQLFESTQYNTSEIRKSRRTGLPTATQSTTLVMEKHVFVMFFFSFFLQAQDVCQTWKSAMDWSVRWTMVERPQLFESTGRACLC